MRNPKLISLADCLTEAARLKGSSQQPAHLWAVREGVARLGPSTCRVLRRTLKERTCVSCGWKLPRLEYILSEKTSPGNPFNYRHHRCIACGADLLAAEGVPSLPLSRYTHWDPVRIEAVNLELGPAGQAEVERLRREQQKQEQAQREALALLVWSMPTVEAAELLGISDVALGKRCRKEAVPKPPRGFWQKVFEDHPVDDLIPPEVGPLLARFGWRGDFYFWFERLPWSPLSPLIFLAEALPVRPLPLTDLASLVVELMDV